MSFLKAIKKFSDQKPEVKAEPREVIAPASTRFSHLIPGLASDSGMKIGAKTDQAVGVTDADGSIASVGEKQTSDSVEFGQQRIASSFQTVDVDESRVNRHLVAVTDPESAFCEEYRNLRATLLQRSKKQKLKTIAVVSTVPSEGKSITALNLAWLIAQTHGINALLIDTDLRVPSLTKYLGVESGCGLSEFLEGTVGLEDVIVRLEPSGLHLLPGGLPKSDVSERFSGPTFTELLNRVEREFDFVIMDAPPLSVFADAKVLMNQADTSILVVRSNYTKFKDVNRVLEGLSGQRILGVVLNRSEETLISGKYYDHQYYQNYKSKS